MGLSLFRLQRRDVVWLILIGLVAAGILMGAHWLGWLNPARAVLIGGLAVLAVALHRMGVAFRDASAFRALLLLVILGVGWAALVWCGFLMAGTPPF